MIYLIAGKIKVGKDTVGNMIKEEFEKYGKTSAIVSISGPLKEYASKYFGWDGREETKPREFLQTLGTEIIREKLGKDDFLINRVCDDIDILSLYFDNIIITGIRRKDEINKIKAKYHNSVSILVKRDMTYNLPDKEKNHYTEVDLDDFNDADYVFDNLSVDEEQEKIKSIVKEGNLHEEA